MSIPPLRFHPILKAKVWGGRSLEALGKKLPPRVAVGESWELADLPGSIPDGRSTVADGPLAGQTLHDILNQHEHEVVKFEFAIEPFLEEYTGGHAATFCFMVDNMRRR